MASTLIWKTAWNVINRGRWTQKFPAGNLTPSQATLFIRTTRPLTLSVDLTGTRLVMIFAHRVFIWEEIYLDYKIEKFGTDKRVAPLNTEFSTYALRDGWTLQYLTNNSKLQNKPIIAHTDVHRFWDTAAGLMLRAIQSERLVFPSWNCQFSPSIKHGWLWQTQIGLSALQPPCYTSTKY